jgi:hypothetical protein
MAHSDGGMMTMFHQMLYFLMLQEDMYGDAEQF